MVRDVRRKQDKYNNTNVRGGLALAALAGLLVSGDALAQAVAPAKAASAAAGGSDLPMMAAPSEAVQRQALNPFRMILNANNNAKPKPAAPAVAVAPAPATPAKRAPATAAPAAAQTAPTLAKAAATADAKPVPAPTVAAVAAAPAPAAATAAAVLPAPATAPAVQQVAAAALTNPAPAAAPALPPAVQAAVRKELVPIQQDPPVLSNALLAEIPRGLVKVRFDVNPDGSTSAVQVASSSNRKLNGPAMAAVSKWRFQPIEAKREAEIDIAFANE
jgi:TonB family protein